MDQETAYFKPKNQSLTQRQTLPINPYRPDSPINSRIHLSSPPSLKTSFIFHKANLKNIQFLQKRGQLEALSLNKIDDQRENALRNLGQYQTRKSERSQKQLALLRKNVSHCLVDDGFKEKINSNLSLKNYILEQCQITREKEICKRSETTHEEANRKLRLKLKKLKKIKTIISLEDSRALINKSLFNLKNLLKRVFSYWTIPNEKIEILNDEETKILINIIESKNYFQKDALIKGISKRQLDPKLWIQFSKTKRKEEYIKYGFKLLVKHLMQSFKDQVFNINLDSILKVSNKQLFFYIFYFGHLEFDLMFEQIIEDIKRGRVTENALWKKLSKYVFPEIGSQIKLPIVRSINKKFLKEISNSRDFINELLHDSLNLLLFFGYCWSVSWKSKEKNEYSEMDKYGIQILKKIGRVNRNEINKLFAEWGNLVQKKAGQNGKMTNMEVVIENIKRSNFKFPWSFMEIQEGIINTFISIVENINFDFLSDESKSKIKSFLNNRTLLP